MTTTVKLPNPLDDSLRTRCSAEGRSISEVMQDALGHDLFGRNYGQAGGAPADLASNRKAYAASV